MVTVSVLCGKAKAFDRLSVPPLTIVPPVNVFAARSVNVPLSVLLMPAAPESFSSTLEMVRVAPAATSMGMFVPPAGRRLTLPPVISGVPPIAEMLPGWLKYQKLEVPAANVPPFIVSVLKLE